MITEERVAEFTARYPGITALIRAIALIVAISAVAAASGALVRLAVVCFRFGWNGL